jgi:hypothetical protein
MTNRICQIQLRDRVLNPAEAEIWVSVVADRVTPGTELRGRLTGPRCPYATTVEVAYPLRPLARPVDGLAGLTSRVVIPEPSWWDPVSPFLYDGSIELWQDGQRSDVVPVRHGLRSHNIAGQRLRFNGRPLTLYATEEVPCSEEEATRLRNAGLNTLLVPVREDTRGVWDLADRLGFLVLGRLPFGGEPMESAEGHPSCLGWLLDTDTVSGWAPDRAGPCVGIELHHAPATFPEGVHFVLCNDTLLPLLATIALPKLVRTEAADARLKELLTAPGVLGIVRTRSA